MNVKGLKERYRLYAWSNPSATVEQLLYAVFLTPRFEALLDFCSVLGIDKVKEVWKELQVQPDEQIEKVRPLVERCLHNINEGYLEASQSHGGSLVPAGK